MLVQELDATVPLNMKTIKAYTGSSKINARMLHSNECEVACGTKRRAGQRRWSERSEGLEKAELERGVRCQSVPCFGGLEVKKSTLRGMNQNQGHCLTDWHIEVSIILIERGLKNSKKRTCNAFPPRLRFDSGPPD